MRLINETAYQERLAKIPMEERTFRKAVEVAEDMPTIDAVPVVQCRHCQSHHWEQEPCHGKTVHYCKKLDAEVTADFFCAAGKRKNGDGNG